MLKIRAVGLLAHGGTIGLVVELVPALALAAVAVAIWARGKRSAARGAGREAGVEEQRGSGE